MSKEARTWPPASFSIVSKIRVWSQVSEDLAQWHELGPLINHSWNQCAGDQMLYDAAGKMNSIIVSLVPFCLGLKLSKKFNQSFQNSMFILCLKAIFLFFWGIILQMTSGGKLHIWYLSWGLWSLTGAEFRTKTICEFRNSEWRKNKNYTSSHFWKSKNYISSHFDLFLTFYIFYLEMLKINNNAWKLLFTFWIQLHWSRWYLRKHCQ